MSYDVLISTKKHEGVEQRVEQLGGRITHRFTGGIIVARLPTAGAAGELSHIAPTRGSLNLPRPRGKTARLIAVAVARNVAEEPALAPTPEEGLPWTNPQNKAPAFNTGAFEAELHPPPPLPGAIALSSGIPTSRSMIGSIALGVVIVSGNSADLVFTDAEKEKVIEQVQKGANFLATAEPRAQVSFTYDIHDVKATAAQGPYAGATDIYEQYEMGWRDAALKKLGYCPGRTGYRAYANALRADQGTKWSYVVFFTKYQLRHFAYAAYEKIVMNHNNDNWGPDNIHRVFAHESCHIFGATDEYGSCVCGELGGELKAPNNNCVNCGASQVPCLMNANTLQFCQWTRKQIGWDAALFPQATERR